MDKILTQELKSILLKKKEDLLKIVSNNESLMDREVGDSVDIASDSAEREMMFELNDYERVMLNDIENAIMKMGIGKYGKCESCNGDISENRLKVIPAARLCINCQSKAELKK